MKNIIITLASVATLAGAANAQSYIGYRTTGGGANTQIATFSSLQDLSNQSNATGSFSSNLGASAWSGITYDGSQYIGYRTTAGGANTQLATFSSLKDLSQQSNATASFSSNLGASAWAGIAYDGSQYIAYRTTAGGANTQLVTFSNLQDLSNQANSTGSFSSNLGASAWSGIGHDGSQYIAYRTTTGGANTQVVTFSNLQDLSNQANSTSSFSSKLGASAWTGIAASDQFIVPEPSSTALLGLGALGFLARRRR